jgi:hypothetical protein
VTNLQSQKQTQKSHEIELIDTEYAARDEMREMKKKTN